MDLYILRHAIAEDRAKSDPGDDSQRRLTLEGKKKMLRAADALKSAGLGFDLILSSPYIRARQTADIVADVFGLRKALHLSDDLKPDGNPRKLIDDLATAHAKRRKVLLVGHEPYLSRFISLLLSGDTALAIQLKKGGLAKLNVEALKYGRCATLEWLLTPRQMRSLGNDE